MARPVRLDGGVAYLRCTRCKVEKPLPESFYLRSEGGKPSSQLARGGAHSPNNIRPAHQRCNNRKGAKVVAA